MKPGVPLSTKKAVIFLRLPRGRVLLARRHEDDGEIGDVGVADEMLGAVQHPVVAVLHGGRLHAAQVRTRAGFGHGEAVGLLAANAGKQIFVALLGRTGEQDVRRTRHAGPVQRVVGLAELLLVEQPGHRIEPGAADIGRHVGRIEPGLDRLGFQLVDEFGPEHAGALDLLLMRVKLVLDKRARRLDDQLLLFRQAEIHGCQPFFLPVFLAAFFTGFVALALAADFATLLFSAGFAFFDASFDNCFV